MVVLPLKGRVKMFLLKIDVRHNLSCSGSLQIGIPDLPTANRLALKLAEILPDAQISVEDDKFRWYAKFYSWGPGTKG